MATNPALATEVFYMTAAEKRKIDFDFTDRLDAGRTLAVGTPTIAFISESTVGGLVITTSSESVSGKLVQCFVDAGATPGVYVLRATHVDDGGTTETLDVDGKVVVTA